MNIFPTRRLCATIIPLAISLAAARAYAQETQVPLDDDGSVERIDQDMEQKLSLFPAVENFEEARLYQLADSSYALEVFYTSDGRRHKLRTAMNAPEAAELRHRVSTAIAARLPAITVDQEGRTALIIGTTVYSLGFYAWAVPTALDISDTKSAVGIYMFTASAGFFAPYLLTANARVTGGDAALSLGAGQLGIAHGMMFNLAINNDGSSERRALGYMMAASIGELVGGYYVADGARISAGKADMIYIGGLFGTGLGAAGGALGDLFDTGHQRAGGLVTLLGAGLGYVGGNALANMQPYTTGDAQVMFGAGLLGAYVPLAIVDLVRGEIGTNAKPYLAASMVGTVAGLGAGHFLVKGKDFSASDGTYVVLGEIAGGLLGTGIAYLAASDQRDNTALYLTTSAVGGLGGFGLMYGLLSGRARKTDTGSLWRFNVAPEGIAAYALRGKLNLPATYSTPILQIQGRF